MNVLLTVFIMGQSAFAQELAIGGCKASDFVQGTEEQVIQTTVNKTYSPRCVRVPKGATVTIQASMHHPLQAMDPIDDVANPFLNLEGASKTPQTHTLTAPGAYGFFCTNHGKPTGEGMSGVILLE